MSQLHQPSASNPSSFAGPDDESGRMSLVIISAGAVFYALTVLWYVVTFPDIGIRCLLPDNPPESTSPHIAVTQFVNDSTDCTSYVLQPGDIIQQINRQPVTNFLDFVAVTSDLRFAVPPGGQLAAGSDPSEHSKDVPGLVEISGASPEDSPIRMVEVVFTRPGADTSGPLDTYVAVKPLRTADFLLTIFWFVCQLAILLVALTAYWRRPKAGIIRTFCFMCAVSMVAFVGGFHWWVIAASPLLNLPFIICATILPAATLNFFCSFPRETTSLKKFPQQTLVTIYGPMIALGLLISFTYWSAFSLSGTTGPTVEVSGFQKLVSIGSRITRGGELTLSSVHTASHLLFMLRNLVYFAILLSTLYFGATVIALTFSLTRTQNALEKRQASGILIASLISTIPICYTLYLAFFRKDEFALGEAQIPMFVASGLFMAAYAHGMLRHRLILADEILERGRLYSLMTGLVMIGFALIVAIGITTSRIYSLPGDSSFLLRASMFMLLILAAVFMLWLRDRLQAAVDRRFFSEKYQLDKTLQQLNQAAGHLADPSAMAEMTLQTCRDVIDASSASMFVRDASGGFRLIGLHSDPGVPTSLPGDALENDEQLGLVVQRVPSSSRETMPATQQLLRSMQADLLCTLRDERGIDGMIFVGRRTTGTPYSAEDIAFLQAIGQMTVMALHSSRANQNLARLNAELKVKVDRIAEQQRQLAMLRAELTSVQDADENSPSVNTVGDFDRAEIRGNSAEIQEVLDIAQKAAASTATVLVRGESGTGKELLARVIHSNSDRSQQALITVNCAALAPSLLESELFGHVRGSFTGAHSDKMGRFQAADGGTLFLDEIGDISLETQVKLLRVLQERSFEPVGSNSSVEVDVRLIAATHRNLEQMIADGQFREDLYYRLNVVSLTLPALRDRREDLIELVFFFLNRALQKTRKRIRQIDPDALALMEQHAWPGNIRELENAIERAVVLTEGDTINVTDLPMELQQSATRSVARDSKDSGVSVQQPQQYEADWATERPSQESRQPNSDSEKSDLVNALELAEGNKARAARLLNLPRSTFYSKLKKYGIGEDEE